MPSKRFFERDLINVNIRKKDWDKLIMRRRYHEPFYSILHRFIETQDTSKDELEYLLNDQKEAAQSWMKRALDAEKRTATLLDY